MSGRHASALLRLGGIVAAGALLVACGATPPPQAAADRAADPLGPQPKLAAPKAFAPTPPQVLSIAKTPPVWLASRTGLPLVSIQIVVPYGSASDPQGKAGLAALTAEMMEQGAGRRGALELGQAAERLGADLSVEADRDASVARLVVLSENLEPALGLLADVVARPRFEPEEWTRTHALWMSRLESRAIEPSAVAGVALLAGMYGPAHPYSAPTDGLIDTVKDASLDDVKGFHARHWRPDRATIIVAGDVDAAQLEALLPQALLEWAAAGEPAPLPTPPAAPAKPPRTVMVARDDAPQTVLIVAEPGPPAADAVQAAAELANIPLGGSFTSRLNSNLREDKGYTYGARSRVAFDRGVGLSVASSAVQAKVTSPALKEMLAELSEMAKTGPTPAELGKARATARSNDIEAYESIAGIADRLAMLAGMGLPPTFDRDLAIARGQADDAAIKAAVRALPSAGGTVIAVGDPAIIIKAFDENDLPRPVVLDPEGGRVASP